MLEPAKPLNVTNPQDTARECLAYTRYLVDQDADDYIQAKYAAAFEAGRPLADLRRSRFESALRRISRIHPLFTRALDGYCRLFDRDSGLRKKLVVLLAIIESRNPGARRLLEADPYQPPFLLLSFLVQLSRSVALLLIAGILLTPVRVVCRGLDWIGGAAHG